MAFRVVMFIGLLLALPSLQSAHEGGAEIDAGSPTLIALERLSVPVRRNGKIVSHKHTFAGKISLGTAVNKPAQEFSVVFDTGSGQIVLPHEKCQSAACRVHKRYNELESDSGEVVNANRVGSRVGVGRDAVTITYGTGSITGELVREHVCLGSSDATDEAHKRLCVETGVVTATAMSDAPFLELQFDGIVGLGLSALAVTPEFNFLNGIAASGGRATFAIYLSSDVAADHELAVSGYNPQRFTGPLHWTPIHRPQQGFWQVQIMGVRVGSQSLDICNNGGCPGIVDSGSSHLGLPKDWLRPLSDLLTTDSEDGADCRQAASPDMYLDFEGFSLKIGSRDYMRKMPLEETSGNDTATTMRCRPKLTPVFIPKSFTTQNFFILGEPLFSRYYTIFEDKEKRVGFGLARHKGEDDKGAALEGFARDQETILLMQVTFEFVLDLNHGLNLDDSSFYDGP